MRRIFVVLLAILPFGADSTSAQDKVRTTHTSFLTIPVGARHWGLGGAGAAIVDPFVAHFNPGGLGVYALTNPVGFARNSQDWAPMVFDPDEVVYANTLILAGFPVPFPQGQSWPRVSVAVAFHRQSFEMQLPFNLFPGGTVDYHSFDRSNGYTLALGIEKGIEVGVGGSIKDVVVFESYESEDDPIEEYEESTTGRDYGVFVRIPFQRILEEWNLLERPIRLGPFTPELTIIGSYAWANRRGEIDDEPLPRLSRFGRTVSLEVKYRDLPLVGWLATRDDEILDLSGGERRHEGWEVDFFGCVRFQKGDEPGRGGQEMHGTSVHSAGVMRWVTEFDGDPENSGLPWWIRNLDIFYRRASVDRNCDSPFGGTEFNELGFTLTTGPLWE